MFNPYAPPTYTMLQTNQLDAGWQNIRLLGRATHRIIKDGEVYALARTFNDAVMIAGPLRLTHGDRVQLERIPLRLIQGGVQ
jgi:hypothetical protein